MSEAVETPSAPAVVETPAAPEAAPKVKNPTLGKRDQLRANLMKGASAVFAKPAPAAPVEPTPTPETSTEAPAPQPETVQDAVAELEQVTGQEAPKQKVGESDQKYAARLAQLTIKLQKQEAETLTQKKARETAERERDEARATLEALGKDVKKALAHAGWDPVKVAQAMADGTLTADEVAAKSDLPPEILAKLERLEKVAAESEAKEAAEKAAQEKREAEAQAAQAREADVKVMQQLVDSSAETFPMLKVLPGAADRLVQAFYNVHAETGELPDFNEVASKMQDYILGEMAPILKDPATRKLFFAKFPDLAAEFDPPKKAAEPKPEVPKPVTITNKLSAAPVRGNKISEKERKARAAAAAASIFGK